MVTNKPPEKVVPDLPAVQNATELMMRLQCFDKHRGGRPPSRPGGVARRDLVTNTRTDVHSGLGFSQRQRVFSSASGVSDASETSKAFPISLPAVCKH